MTVPSLVLASASPRRKRLLTRAGFRFAVDAPRCTEAVREGEAFEITASRLACEKMEEVGGRSPDGVVLLAADTIVVCGGRMFGKPRDREEAVEMLLSLSGRNHRVLTAWAISRVGRPAGTALTGIAVSVVRMRDIAYREAVEYAAGPEPHDKAGAYAVQGDGRRFVAAIVGSIDNVIGLPVATVSRNLATYGVFSETP